MGLPVGSRPRLNSDQAGERGENRRYGSPEVREHRTHFWKSMGRNEWEKKGAGGALMAKVRYQASNTGRFGQR